MECDILGRENGEVLKSLLYILLTICPRQTDSTRLITPAKFGDLQIADTQSVNDKVIHS